MISNTSKKLINIYRNDNHKFKLPTNIWKTLCNFQVISTYIIMFALPKILLG